MSTEGQDTFSKILPFIFFIVGAAMLVVGIVLALNAHQSIQWPTVEAKIIKSEIYTELPSATNDNKRPIYYPIIEYQYIVDETQYIGNRISFGRYGSSNINYSKNVISLYPINSIQVIHYKKDNPATSVLEPGVHFNTFIVGFFGIAFMIVSIISWYMLVKLPAKKAETSLTNND